MSRVLVTGGAGYIGSHIVRLLLERGFEPIVLDNLSAGHRSAVGPARLVVGEVGDARGLDTLMGAGEIDAVIHMAAFCEVGASVADPSAYYRNNVGASLALLDACRRHSVRKFVFSSTAAVYGAPIEVPIVEEHSKRPTNPYGETKLAIERALGWYHGAYGIRHAALRYFNAAGAHPDGTIGEDHAEESHLVPRLLRSALAGEAGATPIFGTDYPTPDGTCVRDYVHVMDLASAHVAALQGLGSGALSADAFNLGNGAGFSVREVIETVGRVTGRRPPTRDADRRAGDPATLVASSGRAREVLGWTPEYPSLEAIVRTAWGWHESHPEGYGDHE